MVKLYDWYALRNVVEGNRGRNSCKIIDGYPYHSFDSIPPDAQPDLRPLADVLRSNAEMPPWIRNWLADLCAPPSKSPNRYLVLKKGRGRPRTSVDRNIQVTLRYLELESAMPRKRVIGQLGMEFDLSTSAIEAAIEDCRALVEEHSLSLETDENAGDLQVKNRAVGSKRAPKK